jgi:hypothetical protein
MCWLGILYGLLAMGMMVGMGWFLEWLEQQGRKRPVILDDEPWLSERDRLRMTKEYEGPQDVDVMIRVIRRCWPCLIPTTTSTSLPTPPQSTRC